MKRLTVVCHKFANLCTIVYNQGTKWPCNLEKLQGQKRARRDSNPRPNPYGGNVLSTELRAREWTIPGYEVSEASTLEFALCVYSISSSIISSSSSSSTFSSNLSCS